MNAFFCYFFLGTLLFSPSSYALRTLHNIHSVFRTLSPVHSLRRRRRRRRRLGVVAPLRLLVSTPIELERHDLRRRIADQAVTTEGPLDRLFQGGDAARDDPRYKVRLGR